jgi:hypothetical protein
LTLSGDLAIADRTVEYGSNRSYNTAITEIEDGKVKRLDNTSLRPSKRRSGEPSRQKK